MEAQANEKGKIMFGAEYRTDYNCRIEYHVKYLNGFKSFSLKGAYYDYNVSRLGLEVMNKYSSNLDGTTLINTLKGFCLKPGWIFHHELSSRFYHSQTLSAVFSRNEIQFNFIYPNDPVTINKIDYKIGAEYEFLLGVRLLKKFLLTTAFQTGIKPTPERVFKDANIEFSSYKHYSPAQGNGRSRMYLNATFGLSFIF